QAVVGVELLDRLRPHAQAVLEQADEALGQLAACQAVQVPDQVRIASLAEVDLLVEHLHRLRALRYGTAGGSGSGLRPDAPAPRWLRGSARRPGPSGGRAPQPG